MTGKFVKLSEELSIHYQESGKGKLTLLLVPGWTMSTQVFTKQLVHFSDSKQYQCIALDPRAHGKSSQTENGHYYEQHGRDLNDFIDALDLQNIVICGWSFATLATLSYVNQFGSDQLSGLIMLDGPPRATGENNEKDWVTYTYRDDDKFREFFTMNRLRNPEKGNVEFAKWMLENPSDAAVEWLVSITNDTPDTAAALLNETANYLDYREDLIAMHSRIPLWYMVREQQLETVSRWAAIHTPDARVDGFGEHLMFWERSETFNQILDDFLGVCAKTLVS